MASNGYIQTNDYHGRYLAFNWWVNSRNDSENWTEIGWNIKGGGSASASWYKAGNFKVVIDGEQVFYSSNRIQLYDGTVVASGSKRMYHDSIGNKNFGVNIECGIYNVAVNCQANGNWWLDQIPRYFTQKPKLTLISKTETSYKFKWETSENCNWVRWYFDNSQYWHDVGFNNLSSGEFEVKTGDALIDGTNVKSHITINENSTHNVKVECRRLDSNLWSMSDNYQNTTYYYPHPTSVNNATIGEEFKTNIYNPLNRQIKVEMFTTANVLLNTYNGTVNGDLKGFNDATTISKFYASIPNAKSGQYYIKTTWNGISRTKGNGTYSCNESSCKPTINANSNSYYDSNSTITAITSNNQMIVQNKSILKIIVGGGTAKNSSTVSKYRVIFNGITKEGIGDLDFGKVNLTSNAKFKVYVIDSRGYVSNAIEKNVSIYEYKKPNAVLKAYRKNNYEDENYFNISASISSVNSKNSIQSIKYGYAQGSSSSPSASTSISNNSTTTNSLNKDYEWKFIATVQDKFETSTFTIILPKGVFIEFWDTNKLSVGINGFPTHSKAMEIFGDLYVNGSDFMNYSTTEKVVGKWVNGKKIYKKTFNYGALPNNSDVGKNHGISNIDWIINIEGVAYNNSYFLMLPYSYPTNNSYPISLYATKSQVGMKTGVDRSSYSAYVTLYYTKTTE